MRLVIVYIRPSVVETVSRAVVECGGINIAFSEVRGYGRQKEHLDTYRPGVLGFAFLPRVRMSFVIESHKLDSVTNAIMNVARTGSIGDGKIFVVNVESHLRPGLVNTP